MKKLFLLSILIFTFAVGSAQDSLAVKSVIPPTVADQVNQVVDNVSNKVVALAEALKVPAEKVFIVMVKQQFIVALSESIVLGVFFIIFILSALTLMNKNSHVYYCDDEFRDFNVRGYITLILSIVSGVIFTIALFNNFNSILTGFFNSEYGAIQEISKMIEQSI